MSCHQQAAHSGPIRGAALMQNRGFHKIIQRLKLEGTFKVMQFQPHCRGLGAPHQLRLPLMLQGWGAHSLSPWAVSLLWAQLLLCHAGSGQLCLPQGFSQHCCPWPCRPGCLHADTQVQGFQVRPVLCILCSVRISRKKTKQEM